LTKAATRLYIDAGRAKYKNWQGQIKTTEGGNHMAAKIRAMAGVAAVAIAYSSMAQAQQPAETSGQTPQAQTETARESGLGDIVVTAQRRSETAFKVPLTVLSNTAAQLQAAGVVDTRDLVRVVPGLVIASQNAWSSPAIRGVSSSITSPGGEGPVAIYIDGIYQPSQQGAYADLPDVERVEVLKGPQGTLFGRNATAGAIQVTTKGPSFTTTGQISVDNSVFFPGNDAKNAHQLQFSAFLAGPISETLAGSISISERNQGGYSINDANGAAYGAIRSHTYRAKLLFQPTESFSLAAGAFHTKRYDENVTNGAPIGGNALVAGIPGVIYPTKDYHVAFNTTTPHLEFHETGGYLKADFDVGIGSITNTATYRTLKSNIHINTTGVAALPSSALGVKCFQTFKCLDYEVNQDSESYSDELLFSTESTGPISLVAGLFAYHENAQANYILNNYPGSSTPGGFLSNFYRVRTTSYAGFASINYDVTDQLHLSGGARYTYDKKTGPENLFTKTLTTKKITPRASIRYDWTSNFNTYFTYSQGFRSGIFSVPAARPIKPEYLTSYEVGAKYQSNNARFNVSFFKYDYSDLQLSTFTGVISVLANASAKLSGMDFDGEVRLGEHFKLRGGGSYLPQAKYINYKNAVAFNVSPAMPVHQYDGTATCGSYCGIGQQSLDASGNRMLKAPRFTGFLGVTYTSKSSGGELVANLSAYHTSTYNYDQVNLVQTKAYTTFDGDISFSPSALDGLKAGLYGKNITGAKWLNGSLISGSALIRYFSPPPEVGIRVGYSF
jgi:iron complex outermembrane receptor protein